MNKMFQMRKKERNSGSEKEIERKKKKGKGYALDKRKKAIPLSAHSMC